MNRWTSGFPFAFVLFSLFSLAVIPFLVQWRVEAIRAEITEVVEPARARVGEILLGLAQEAAGTRGYLLTGDSSYASAHRVAREGRRRAQALLLPLGRRLGPEVEAGVAELAERIQPADARLDSLFGGLLSRDEFMTRLPQQQVIFMQVTSLAARLGTEIGEAAAARRERVGSTQRNGTWITALLVLFALVAAILVRRLGRGYRTLAERLDLRARGQAALREIARDLSATTTTREVVDKIAAYAIGIPGVYGSYVEKIERPERGPQVEIAAAAGKRVPAVGTRIAYPGSLTEEMMESVESDRGAARPENGKNEESARGTETLWIGGRMVPHVTESRRERPGRVVPLASEGAILGAVVVLRSPDQEPLSPEDESHLRALGDLASVSLRRVLLLEELRESETRFRQIADHLHEVIWLSDAELTHRLYLSPAYEKIWGLPQESPYGNPQPPLEAVHPEDRARVREALSHLRRGEYDLEYRIVRPDGGIRWLWSRAYAIRNERGEVYRIAGIMEDITERVRAAEERERLLASEREARAESERRREELQRVTDSRAGILRGFTHDLKNPLGAADGYAALLEDGVLGRLPEKQKDSIHRIRRSIGAALGLIEDLLDLERAEAGEIDVVRGPMDLGKVVRETGEEYRAQAEAKGLSLTIEVPDDLPPLDSDAQRIAQVIGNLLSNAVKYTTGVEIGLTVSVRSDDDSVRLDREWVTVAVSDTGPGISDDQQPYLFEEFRRLDTAGEEKGVGIGLAISRRIAVALGGDITVHSAVGHGSTFTFWLPISGSMTGASAPAREPTGRNGLS